MKAELLKIAGVKSEKEFYKKFPTEETFMKKHGKAVKSMMAKKAKVGTMIKNIETPTSNIKPIRIDEEFLYDAQAVPMGKKTMQEVKEDDLYQAQMESLKPKEEKKNGLLSQFSGLGSLISESGLEDFISGGGFGGSSNVTDFEVGPLEQIGPVEFQKGGKISKSQNGAVTPLWGQDIDLPVGKSYSSPTSQFFNLQSEQGVGQNVQNVIGSDVVQKWGLPIYNDVKGFIDQTKAQKEKLAQAKQNRMLSELTLQAAKTEPERIEREYVRPEDIQNTGEEFFPIYGVGTNVLKNGGMFSDPGYVPLENVNQVKAFGRGGVLGSNSYLVPKAEGGISYGGGQFGQLGMQAGDMVGFNNDAGSNIGGKIGGTVGSAFGPIGSTVGSFIGSGIGDLLDRDDRRTRIEQEKGERALKELSYTAIAPAIQAGYASHVKNGGIIDSMRSGGQMRGNYVPPNPSALDTMAMGGDVKTTWGGKVETVSYNPYAGGESIEFKGNSHGYRDPRTGQTGIGVAYGKNSVANNEAVVEVENEPAQQLKDGGGTENLVVYGDLKIPEEYIGEIGDDRAKGKKFKNYVSDVLNKDEVKINKKMENAADKGLESDNTKWGQLERSTADVILKGSDMKLKNIAEKKNILADLQNALNETFDEYGIKGNEFITKNKIVEDPERVMNNMAKDGIEINPENKGKFTAWAKERGMSVAEAANKVMANTDEYSPGVVKMANFAKNARKFKKGQDGLTLKQLPEEFETEAAAIEAGYIKQDDGTFVKEEEVLGEENIDRSAESMENIPAGQSKQDSGFYGNVSQSDFAELQTANSWYDWKNFDPSNEADVRTYQIEFNKRAKEAGSKARIKVDGKFGQQTASARYKEKKEQPKKTITRTAKVNETSATPEVTAPISQQRGIPFMGTPAPVKGESLDSMQIMPEYAALSSNVLEPVYAQTYQPRLRVPYDISLQAAKNDVISQSRALQRNPALQNNPAALALAQAPTYEALNKLNEAEFIANQKMKDNIYSGNLEAINKARLMNLGIYDKQQDRQAEAVAKTKATTLSALSSIADKYAKKKLENRLEQVYANMYPTYRYDDQFRTRVQQPAIFNVPGYGSVSGIPELATPGFNPALQQVPNVLGQIQSILGAQKQFNEERGPKIINKNIKDVPANEIYDYVYPNQMYPQDDMYTPIEESVAKKGKTVKKKNYKNSNILRALRDL